MSELGDKIVAEARTWIGTKWGHQKMIKGLRCDCSGLVRGVIETVTGERYGDLWEYSHRPDARFLIKMLNKYFTRISTNEMRLGDILLFKVDNNPQHLAIKTDKGMIHSYAVGPRRVEEVSFADPWPERLVGVWRVPPNEQPRSRGVTTIGENRL
jgi:NlpC/P60 family putative phage cell wall peptidase